MTKLVYFSIFSAVFLVTACSIKTDSHEIAIKEYCDCFSKINTDTLFRKDLIDSTKFNCLKSVIKKFKPKDETIFLTELDSNDQVISINKKLENQIVKNVESVLVKNVFYSEELLEYRSYTFDGKMYTQIHYDLDMLVGWLEDNRWVGLYDIKAENNGKIYLTVYHNEEKHIYEFYKSSSKFHLDGSRLFSTKSE